MALYKIFQLAICDQGDVCLSTLLRHASNTLRGQASTFAAESPANQAFFSYCNFISGDYAGDEVRLILTLASGTRIAQIDKSTYQFVVHFTTRFARGSRSWLSCQEFEHCLCGVQFLAPVLHWYSWNAFDSVQHSRILLKITVDTEL